MRRLLSSTPALIVVLWGIWSTVFLAVKVGAGLASAGTYTSLRVLAAVLALWVLALATPERRRSLRSLRVHRAGLFLGLTNVSLFMLLQTVGVHGADVGIASVLIYTQPILVALGAAALLGERLDLRQAVGILIGWAGVAIVVIRELNPAGTPLLYLAVLLLAALSWAAGTLIFKASSHMASPWVLLFLQALYGLVPVLAYTALTGHQATWGAPLVLSALWAGVGGIVGGFGLQFTLLRRGKAGVVSSWIFPVPILAGLLGILFLGEPPRLALAAGAAAVALGIILVNAPRRGPARPSG